MLSRLLLYQISAPNKILNFQRSLKEKGYSEDLAIDRKDLVEIVNGDWMIFFIVDADKENRRIGRFGGDLKRRRMRIEVERDLARREVHKREGKI